MKSGRSSFLVVAAACATLLFARPSLASEPGYDVWFAGRVLSVDSHNGRLRIARGPTETAGRAIEDCIVAGADLSLVRPGMHIEARADTRRRPWKVLHLRLMKLKTTQPQGAKPSLAITARRMFASIAD